MYASVTIYCSTHQDALTIPRDALIRAAGSDRVVVALGEGRYRVHEVMTGIESGDWVEIIAGLEAGDEVVTSAQFMIDSEASLSGSLRRLEGADSAEPGQRTVWQWHRGVLDPAKRR
jgi:Cu(I)/Ag(I) efflux system membrane fusion protein